MAIQSITGAMPAMTMQQPEVKAQRTPFEAQQNFSAMLNDAIHQVDNTQKVSDTMTAKLAKGEDVDLHNVMISAQKASIALNATVEMRNKVVEAYQEIIRMPV
ncbi:MULTISPECIES: flagellar hook-basal body complex protein FliE [unclassified Sporosarcina]|uniref:flagellar hook-basal body complex protein FliE n=1 Tax=unclassified Sporosarcina TaxID=2647733 RepID=UPI000C170A0E|nr:MULTISPECIES: flagellar hook-basal body complex protein FliE [unclassified Sporosarcina]PID00158.1 flagellar hook-basal body complex protein FliE [Sporosarcina sp. P29]PID06841.1 flagellar hook-basal body complex protein FliE [Sporosarcina sp. P30]PID10036.1 flagellar hook-basal body complex protein FliE [Sporosarcina sp. P31]PID13615.1 flagellar hook-basal body complex protein FliE [Sporosarcina sp. P32b]